MSTLRIPAHTARPEAHGKPVRTARGAVRTTWAWTQRLLIAAAVVLLITIGLLPRLGLYRPVTVLSGSMRPTFSPGDMVIVRPEPMSSLRVGRVISYHVPVGAHQVETHRIVRILSGGPNPTIQTRGDANNTPDAWTARLEGSTVWRQVAVIPHLGYLINALRGHTLHLVTVFVAPALLALLLLVEIWGSGSKEGLAPVQPAPRRTRIALRVNSEGELS